MLQEYAQDPFIDDCLNQITNLQKILKEGSVEQYESAQSLIIDLVELLQKVNLDGLVAKSAADKVAQPDGQATAGQAQDAAASQL